MLFTTALVLTILSVVAIIVGATWAIREGGRTRQVSGPEVGAAFLADQMDQDEELDQITVAERSATAFKGQATMVQTNTEISFGEIKAALNAGRLRQVLPMLLAIGGLLGLILFGSLALLFGLENRVIGAAALAIALYTIYNIARGFARA